MVGKTQVLANCAQWVLELFLCKQLRSTFENQNAGEIGANEPKLQRFGGKVS